jgi:hypothetical protein
MKSENRILYIDNLTKETTIKVTCYFTFSIRAERDKEKAKTQASKL